MGNQPIPPAPRRSWLERSVAAAKTAYVNGEISVGHLEEVLEAVFAGRYPSRELTRLVELPPPEPRKRAQPTYR